MIGADIKEWFYGLVASIVGLGTLINQFVNTYILLKGRREARADAIENLRETKAAGLAAVESVRATVQAGDEGKARGLELGARVEEVHKLTDGVTAKLVAITAKESHAAGVLEGHAEGEARAATLEEGRKLGREESNKS